MIPAAASIVRPAPRGQAPEATPENPENSAADRMKAGLMRRPRARIFRTFRIFRKVSAPARTQGCRPGAAPGASAPDTKAGATRRRRLELESFASVTARRPMRPPPRGTSHSDHPRARINGGGSDPVRTGLAGNPRSQGSCRENSGEFDNRSGDEEGTLSEIGPLWRIPCARRQEARWRNQG